jgi:hypothetical protein
VEPYDVRVQEWVAETSERVVPVRTLKRVPMEVTRMVPVTEVYRVPIDAFGNPIYGMGQELVETRRPTSTVDNSVYYGNLEIDESPVQVVEGSTLNSVPRRVIVERVPYVDSTDLVSVVEKKHEAENQDDAANRGDQGSDDQLELRKPPLPESGGNESGTDNVDLKKQGNDSAEKEGDNKTGDNKAGDNKQPADQKPNVDPQQDQDPGNADGGNGGDGQLSGPRNDG